MVPLVALTLLPLAVIVLQSVLGATGAIGDSIYKAALLIPPLVWCRWQGISIRRDILKFRNGRNGLPIAVVLGLASIAIFVGAYAAWGDELVDESHVVERIAEQFDVTARTVMLVAPFTIVVNSLLEEFFYRGFSFGLLAKHNRPLAYLLQAVVFTVQHVLFIHDWVTLLPLVLAIVGLFVLALVLAWVYARYDTIVAPWVIHACGDAAMMGIAVSMLH